MKFSHTKAGNTMDSKQSQANRPKSLYQKIGEETNGDVINSQENLHVDLHRRRHAINITSNPGYRVSFTLPRLLVFWAFDWDKKAFLISWYKLS